LLLWPQSGVAKPAEVLNKQGLNLIGEAQFSVLFWDIYHSSLYNAEGRYQGVTPGLVFEIRYQRSIEQEQLIERTIEQWQHLKLPAESYQRYLPQLKALWPAIKKGDRLALVVAEQQSHFYLNDRYLGSVSQPEFATDFLAIWLSKQSSVPDMAKQLTGGWHDNNPAE